jgi:hypothetical protein
MVLELAGGRELKKAHMRQMNSSLVSGSCRPRDFEGDEPQDVCGEQGVDGADDGLIGESGPP